jgi:hypothetical protein
VHDGTFGFDVHKISIFGLNLQCSSKYAAEAIKQADISDCSDRLSPVLQN